MPRYPARPGLNDRWFVWLQPSGKRIRKMRWKTSVRTRGETGGAKTRIVGRKIITESEDEMRRVEKGVCGKSFLF